MSSSSSSRRPRLYPPASAYSSSSSSSNGYPSSSPSAASFPASSPVSSPFSSSGMAFPSPLPSPVGSPPSAQFYVPQNVSSYSLFPSSSPLSAAASPHIPSSSPHFPSSSPHFPSSSPHFPASSPNAAYLQSGYGARLPPIGSTTPFSSCVSSSPSVSSTTYRPTSTASSPPTSPWGVGGGLDGLMKGAVIMGRLLDGGTPAVSSHQPQPLSALVGSVLTGALATGTMGAGVQSAAAPPPQLDSAGGSATSEGSTSRFPAASPPGSTALERYFPDGVRSLKKYFVVSHEYVFKKLVFLFFPFILLLINKFKKKSGRYSNTTNNPVDLNNDPGTLLYQKSNDTNFTASNEMSGCIGGGGADIVADRMGGESGACYPILTSGDIYSTDLYIPLMSIISYVLLYGLSKGALDHFSPELLGSTITFSLILLLLETFLAKLVLYIVEGGEAKLLDILSLCGSKYVHVCAVVVGGLACAGMPGAHDSNSSNGATVSPEDVSESTRPSALGGRSPGRVTGIGGGVVWRWLAGMEDQRTASGGGPHKQGFGNPTCYHLYLCLYTYLLICTCYTFFYSIYYYRYGEKSDWAVQQRRNYSQAALYVFAVLAVLQAPLAWVLTPKLVY